jgi:hypothetical protein
MTFFARFTHHCGDGLKRISFNTIIKKYVALRAFATVAGPLQ